MPYFSKENSAYYVREEIAVPTDPEKLAAQAQEVSETRYKLSNKMMLVPF